MDLTHTSSGPVLLVPTVRYHGVFMCVRTAECGDAHILQGQ